RGESSQAGSSGWRGLPEAAGLSGRFVSESVQSVWQTVASVSTGRRRGARERERHTAVLRAQQRRKHGSAVFAGDYAKDSRSRIHEPLQRLPGRAGSGRGGTGLQFGTSDGGA